MNYLIRALIAAFACVLIFALMPPLFDVIGLQANAALMQVIRICVAGIAVFYVIRGGPVV